MIAVGARVSFEDSGSTYTGVIVEMDPASINAKVQLDAGTFLGSREVWCAARNLTLAAEAEA